MLVFAASVAAVYFGRQFRRRQNVDEDDNFKDNNNQESLISKFKNPFKRNQNNGNNDRDDEYHMNN